MIPIYNIGSGFGGQVIHDDFSQNKEKAFAKVLAENLKKLPIREIDFLVSSDKHSHEVVIKCVDQILAAKNVDGDTSALEKEIDRIVYELYGLTEEEIGIVEGASKT